MTKKISLLLSLLLLSVPAYCEDPPPIPNNPFQNLPNNADPSSFNPFDDDLEEMQSDSSSDNSSSPVGKTSPAAPSNSAANKQNKSNIDPANSKDMVDNFDYPDAEILDVAKAISKLTGKNFIYNPQDIKGRISVVSETPITVGDAYNAFLTALNMKGFALIPSGKYLRIDRVANVKEKQTPIYAKQKAPNNEEFITRVVPLRYIDATEFEQTFRLWIPREARMQAYTQTNTLIITDTAIHINRLLELISFLDVAGYQESLVVVPIRNAAAKDIAKLIEQIINEARSSRNTNPFNASPRPQTTLSTRIGQGGTGRTGGVSISKIIADDRTNSLIVKANAAGIVEIKALVRRLDTKITAAEGSGRIHVIRLQFADAETLAKTLSGINATPTQSRTTNTQTRTFTPFGEAANTSVFQGDIKINADKTTQSLVITASPQDFTTVKKVVEALDVPRDQVFVQAIIMEMKMNRDKAFGTSFVSAANGIGLTSASGNLINSLAGNTVGINGLVLGFKSGNDKASITLPDKRSISIHTLNGLLELVQANKDANVIATPQIIALDNQDATIEISESIPLETTQQNGTTSTNSITQDTAKLLLKVKPQINKASNFVKLDIEQKLENFDSSQVPQDLSTRAKGKNTRATTTSVIVQDEDTVVLSGLIRDSIDEVTNKVPLLGDIPIIGWLFKNQKTEARKTNLLVFITPKIIKQYDSIRKILENRLSERDDYVREHLGSSDPFGKHINKLRKSLPNLTKINPMPQVHNMESTSIPSPSSPDREDSMEEMYYDDYGIPPPQSNFNLEPMPGDEALPPPPVIPSDVGDY